MNALEQLIARLTPHYPDFSDFTVTAMSGRGRDLLHDNLHRRLGGLMPRVLNFDDYKAQRIGEQQTGLSLTPEEALIRFYTFLKRKRNTAPPPDDAERLLHFLTLSAKYSVSMDDFSRAERLPDEQLHRIANLFELTREFRKELAGIGRFYVPLEEEIWSEAKPRSSDLFFGLPLMTPVNEQFFARIARDNLFTDAPVFGPPLADTQPDYESALTLVRRLNLPEHNDNQPELSFIELTDLSSLTALVGRTIAEFLESRTQPSEQLMVILLDETLSFYLWEMVFRPLGDQVNFALWLPFRYFGAAHRLLDAIRRDTPLTDLRREITTELANRWHELDAANRTAGEKAVTLIDMLTELTPLMGDDRSVLAQHLINNSKLYLTGSRNAPVQVAPLGETTGVPYRRALLLPMDRDIFPTKPFDGPFLNLLHVPRIHKAMFEADDLALRRFLAFGDEAQIAARYDLIAGIAPSPYFTFISTEFNRPRINQRLAATAFTPPDTIPVIENDTALREWLSNFSWSFSSLSAFFTCPYRFLLEKYRQIEPPTVLESEETANLIIGNFIHKFFAGLPNDPDPLTTWRAKLEEQWAKDTEVQEKIADQVMHKAILVSYLEDIAARESEADDRLLFSKNILKKEHSLNASFGAGQYRLTGKLDRLQQYAGRLLVVDLKYKANITNPPRNGLAESIAGIDALKDFNDYFQLALYIHLLETAGQYAAADLDAAFLLIRSESDERFCAYLPETEITAHGAVMDAVAQRLDDMAAQPAFAPNFNAEGCAWCRYQALCLRPDLYRGEVV
ncbi:MAG: RecB family exonuclease [Kiritimatiellia bacterium]